MLNSAWFEALTAACPLAPYILPSLPTKVSKLWGILPGLHHTGCDKIHQSSRTDLLLPFPFKQGSNKLIFSLAQFIKVFLISLLLAAFPFSCLVHLFSLSFTEIPGVPSTTFLPAMTSSLLLFPTPPLNTCCAAICVSSCMFCFYFPSSKISLFLTFYPSPTPLRWKPHCLFSVPSPVWPEASPRCPGPCSAAPLTDGGGDCSLEHNQSHLPARHQGWWHRVHGWSFAFVELLSSPQLAGKFKIYSASSDNFLKANERCFSKLLHSNC